MVQLARTGQLDNLTTSECINEYATPFQTSRSDVLIVSDLSSKPTSKTVGKVDLSTSRIFRRRTCPQDLPFGFEWICPRSSCERTCRSYLPEIKRQPNNWKPFGGNPVRYCLSRPERQRCRLNFDLYIAAVILGVNLIKAAVLVHIVLHSPIEPLFVLGDAIQSLLKSPDVLSRGSCLASKDLIRTRHGSEWMEPVAFSETRRFWGVAATKTRWTFNCKILLSKGA